MSKTLKLNRIYLRVLFMLVFLSNVTYSQNCFTPAPAIVTNVDVECILYNSDDGRPTPDLGCWQVCSSDLTAVLYSVIYQPGHSYTWSVGGGTINGGQSTSQISVLWTLPGDGVVQVTETDANGCSITVEHCVSIVAPPTAIFTSIPFSHSDDIKPLKVCFQQEVEFIGQVTISGNFSNISNWLWDFGDPSSPDNISTSQNPTHVFTNPNQSYHVQLTVSNECGCTVYADMFVDVEAEVGAVIECATPVCEGDFDTYVVNANCSGGTYSWWIEPPGAGVITSNPPYGNTITVQWFSRIWSC